MELSPAQITEASFRTIRKGYDPDEVDTFLADCASALEAARQQATAMEARARAAVARLQEATAAQSTTEAPPTPATSPSAAGADAQPSMPRVEADMISRTLLLAQRTADNAVAEAKAEAERIVKEASLEAETTIDSTREMSAQLLEDAKREARKATENERQAAENEVQALVARREFLVGDVDQLERFLIDQRDRLRGAARQIEALCDRVPAGLGSIRPPALSASDDDEPGDPTMEMDRPSENVGSNGRSADDSAGDDPAPHPDQPIEVAEPVVLTADQLPLRPGGSKSSEGRPPEGDQDGTGDASGPPDR